MPVENGQYETRESFYHLEIACRYISAKFGKPEFSGWTNGDYLRLSSILSRATSVQISPNTLKRIFGKLKTPERYFPQRATRDALVQFAGFRDWESFVDKHPSPQKSAGSDPVIEKPAQEAGSEFPTRDLNTLPVNPAIESTEWNEQALQNNTENLKKTGRKRSLKGWALAIAIMLLVLIPTYLYFRPGNNTTTVAGATGISFTCKNPTGRNPHSAVFRLSLDKTFLGDAEKFSIFFGDSRPPARIRDGVILTHYYEIPGRYYAKLLYDGRPVDTIPVFLQTSGWTATATVERDSMRVYPVPADSIFSGSEISASTYALQHSGVDTNKTFYVDFVNTKPTEIDGDNFVFNCNISSSPERPGVRCSQLMLTIYGEKTFHKVFILKPGCEAFTNLTFSDFFRDGKEDDLNFLGADFSTGGKLQLNVKDKQVKLLVNDSEIYHASYKQPLGKIYGLKINFSGVGKINQVALTDNDTENHFSVARVE